MLHHFTWHAFLIAAAVLTFVWYLVFALFFYRKELFGLLAGRPRVTAKSELLPHRWEQTEEAMNTGDESDELMGAAREPEGLSRIRMDEVRFAEPPAKVAGRAQSLIDTVIDPEDLQGLVPDVLEAIKDLLYRVEEASGGKADFVALFSEVAAQYPQLPDSPYFDLVKEWIWDQVPFALNAEELDSLWTGSTKV